MPVHLHRINVLSNFQWVSNRFLLFGNLFYLNLSFSYRTQSHFLFSLLFLNIFFLMILLYKLKIFINSLLVFLNMFVFSPMINIKYLLYFLAIQPFNSLFLFWKPNTQYFSMLLYLKSLTIITFNNLIN